MSAAPSMRLIAYNPRRHGAFSPRACNHSYAHCRVHNPQRRFPMPSRHPQRRALISVVKQAAPAHHCSFRAATHVSARSLPFATQYTLLLDTILLSCAFKIGA
eukprot:4980630-Pleurochrysis_carterae.AAC.2